MTRAWLYFALVTFASGAAIAPLGCSASTPASMPIPTFSPDDLRDPQKCMACHPSHYGEWAQSMHAYAADDPVFLAMNARGQRETGGKLGTFCVQCHAPVAVKDGKTRDGLNLASLAQAEKGVTCFFCHTIDSVGSSHVNADVGIANDLVMRGEIKDPHANSAHASTYSALQDDSQLESAQMCGSCHDITINHSAQIERTSQEWGRSIQGSGGTTCAFNGNCHMASDETPAQIATGGPRTRKFHGHDFRAVDIAFNPTFPSSVKDQTAKIESLLTTALQGAVCVNSRGGVRVFLDNAGVAHDWPSGAAQDRRAWVEVVAEKNGAPFYSSGSVPAGTPVGADPNDRDLWLLRDQMFGLDGSKVDMFWQAACAAGNELPQLAPPSATMPSTPTHRERLYPNTPIPGDSVLPQMPDKVTVTVHLQPIGLDVLSDLVASKDLDPMVATQVPTLTVALPNVTDAGNATSLVWTAAAATPGYPDRIQGAGVQMSCVSTAGFNVTGGTAIAQDPPATCPGQIVTLAPDGGTTTALDDSGAVDAALGDATPSDARAIDAGTL